MTSTPKQATRARYNLPAGLIFTAREQKQYRRWQILYTSLKSTEFGLIPTATEYENFQQWLKKQDSGYFSDVFDDIYEHIKPSTASSEPTIASLCRHPLHPIATGQSHLRCPVCQIHIHINYMRLLTRMLHSANGRPLPRTGTPSEQQENLYLAWCQGKLSTLRQVCELEELSLREEEWSRTHADTLREATQSATKALELYWFETAECLSIKQRSTKNKNVTFAQDTNFLPGRPTDYFLKRSPRYEPGKYTGDDQDDDDDVSEDSEDYSSARVFVPGAPEDTHTMTMETVTGKTSTPRTTHAMGATQIS
ncbi:hypothetical protein BDU57DRAFT_44648 [Ampelomyces quisqualis]|uniref:Uncharacterized protein n=1 Tax=Ampelomyces quisqualis TaxID=50730 RepID=A0A6A5QZM9_AMPQU|nr:hypothetical protein BDU57DRAFT_44648 [Ampelomyces quisqualis]